MKNNTVIEAGSAVWVECLIREYWAASPQNSLNNGSDEKAWDEPLVGFTRANDA